MTEPIKCVGRVIKISKAGWGFISSKDIEFTRIFFHWTALQQDTLRFPELKTGIMVEFVPTQVPGKGFRAIHVRVIETPKKEEKEATHESNGIPEAQVSPLSE